MPTKRKTSAKAKTVLEKPMRVLVAFCQDRSGSMGGAQWKETLNGFKVFIDDLQSKEGVDYFFSLTCFDTLIDKPLVAVPINDVNPHILAEYGPRGGTALYDALGATITDIEKLGNDFDKIICVIVTDGQNNASTNFGKDTIHSMIDSKLNSGKWTFTYLGTQPETWADAAAAGFSAGSTVRYNTANVGATYSAMASALNNFSLDRNNLSCRTMTRSYADPELLVKAAMEVGNE